jgi:ribonuclease P protein component
MRQTFSKNERLHSYRLIRKLFSEGSVFYVKPFRINWLNHDALAGTPLVQVMMSVPKYNFHNAVDRNLVRRRMREAFRLNKNIACEPLAAGNNHLLICITYTAKEIVPFGQIQEKIILLLHRLIKENEKVTG